MRRPRDIGRAYEGRVWLALGYETWDSYLAGEFGAAPLRVPREERPVVVASLRDAGMSTRAIAAATGVSHETVRKDERSGVKKLTPESEPAKATGLDGRQYPRHRPAPPLPSPAPAGKEPPEPKVVDALDQLIAAMDRHPQCATAHEAWLADGRVVGEIDLGDLRFA